VGSGPAVGPTPLADALSATRSAYSEPGRAAALATGAIARAPRDAEVAAVAGRALGMAACARGDLTEATRRLRTTIAYAARSGFPVRAAEARGSLAYVLVLTGRGAAALRELDAAEAAIPEGVSGARLRMQRGLVLSELRRVEEARVALEQALEVLHRAGHDDVTEADIRNNLAIVSMARLDWGQVGAQLDRAEELFTRAGLAGRTAMVWHNRAIALGLQGAVPAALAAFDESDRRYRAAGMTTGALSIDRAEALLAAGLVAEARTEAQAAATVFAERDNRVDLVQARVLLAEACLLDGDPAAARAAAAEARRAAIGQGRPGWAALAAFALLRAREVAGDPPRRLLAPGRRVAADLATAGWQPQAMDALVLVARSATRCGRAAEARQALDTVRRARARGPAATRIRAWHAEAMYRAATGDSSAAASAVRAGLRVVEDFRASLGATDLRAHVSFIAADLAALRLRAAIDSGRPPAVLAASEDFRAAHLWLRPVAPPGDAELADDLAALRRLDAERRAGEVSPRAALAAQLTLERTIRDRARHAVGTVPPTTPSRKDALGRDLHGLRGVLGGRTLLDYVTVDGGLHAVVVGPTSSRLTALGPVAGLLDDVESLRSGLRWMGQPTLDARSHLAARALVDAAASRLHGRLLGPLGDLGGDSPLVVVPTAELTALPWTALPGLTERAVAVTPSAGLWLAATTAARDGRADRGPVVLASGPDLAEAAQEITELVTAYGTAEGLTGPEATVEAVLAALEGAAVAHLAAHGRFRADNPMFSSLRLADGPLTVHDLERLRQAPALVVLAACDSAVGAMHAGDEVLGLAASLLALGTRTLIAPLLPVPDEATGRLMVGLHEHLRAGRPPGTALALARRAALATGRADDAAAAVSFSCLGAG